MSDTLIEKKDNPKIDDAGRASFGKNHYCVWKTKDGSISNISIQNPGRANTLTFVISGAPSEMKTTDGEDLNGKHTIPPNNPTSNITALGNFRGQVVTIFNISSLDATCDVSVVLP